SMISSHCSSVSAAPPSAQLSVSTDSLVSHFHARHPHLPSFPTRRSSDLRDGKLPSQWSQHLSERHPAGGSYADRYVNYLKDHHEDRKSTRLNSSHVKISYAVFCLKKKTFTNWVQGRGEQIFTADGNLDRS